MGITWESCRRLFRVEDLGEADKSMHAWERNAPYPDCNPLNHSHVRLGAHDTQTNFHYSLSGVNRTYSV